MADDRGKRRLATHRDHQRPKTGIPVEIDPELTPPPREPPTAEAFAELPIAAKVDALHHVQQEHAAGFERIWEVRHASAEIRAQSQRIERLETAVSQDTRQVTELIAKVQLWGQMSKEAWDKSDALSAKQIRLDERLAVFFDEQFPDLVTEIKALGRLSTRIADAENEIADIKSTQSEQAAEIVKLDGRLKVIETKAVESTIRSDERRRWLSYVTKGRAALVAVVAAIAAAVTYLSQQL